MDERTTVIKVLLKRLRRKREPSAFIEGDATGAVFINVDTDADIFTDGDREDS